MNTCLAIDSMPNFKNNFNFDFTEKPIKLEELFYNKHLNTDYSPIKLEASLSEPLVISLEETLAQSIANNLNFKISQLNSTIAKWQFWNQFGQVLPDLTYRFTFRNLDGTFFLNSRIQAPVNETQAQSSMRINYRAFDGGTTTFLTLAEKFYKNSAKDNEKDQYNFTLLKSVEFYNNLLKEQMALSSKLKTFEEASANLDLAKKFLEANVGTKFDVLQAEARLARAQQQLIEQEANFRIAEIVLAEHLNMRLLSPLRAKEEELTPLHIVSDTIGIDQFIQTAKKQNPKILSTLKAKQGAVREALSKIGIFLPKLDLFSDFTATGETATSLTNVTSLGMQATIEFGDGLGFRPLTDIMKAKAKAQKAELQYKQVLLEIEKNLRLAFLSYEKSKSLLNATEKELMASREALKLSKLRYQNGIDILFNLIEKEKELANAEITMINSIADYNLAQVQIAYHMGTISVENILNLLE